MTFRAILAVVILTASACSFTTDQAFAAPPPEAFGELPVNGGVKTYQMAV